MLRKAALISFIFCCTNFAHAQSAPPENELHFGNLPPNSSQRFHEIIDSWAECVWYEAKAHSKSFETDEEVAAAALVLCDFKEARAVDYATGAYGTANGVRIITSLASEIKRKIIPIVSADRRNEK